MTLRRRALIGGAVAALPGVAMGAPCGEDGRRKLLKFGNLLIPDALACGGAAAGPGPPASSGFIQADFTNLTGRTVAPQLFGISTGGLANPGSGGLSGTGNQWADVANFSGLRTTVRNLNAPLMRVNSNWQNSADTFSGTMLDNLLNNITNLFPSSITIVFGIQCSTQNNSTYFNFSKAFCQYWKDHAPAGYKLAYLECMNEQNGLARSTYNSCFSGMVAGAQSVDATIKGAGCTDSFFVSGNVSSLIGSQSASTLGLLDWHAYQYLGGVDATPTDFQMMTSAAAPNNIGSSFASAVSTAAGTYAAGLPGLMGEWNIESGANVVPKTQTNLGAGYMISSLLKGASGSASPAWGAIWDPYFDGTYSLITGSAPDFPPASAQYYALQNLIRAMPGTMVNTTTGNGNMLAWATKTGAKLGMAIVNANTSSQSGQIALSHWPVNGSGTSTATLWRLDASNYTTGGTTGPISVTGGLVQSSTLSPMSVAVLSCG